MSGPDDGTLLRLPAPHSPEGYMIGRREDCDVVLPYDSQISRQHARITFERGVWYLEDMGSKNGTHLEKVKLESQIRVVIDEGQMFRMGRTWLRLQRG
ncbi:MAG: FHA domain-containing protein [Anaerolineae bacterium]|nr:FHA domain-containing protein [Anaerolineae bacterium]